MNMTDKQLKSLVSKNYGFKASAINLEGDSGRVEHIWFEYYGMRFEAFFDIPNGITRIQPVSPDRWEAKGIAGFTQEYC